MGDEFIHEQMSKWRKHTGERNEQQ